MRFALFFSLILVSHSFAPKSIPVRRGIAFFNYYHTDKKFINAILQGEIMSQKSLPEQIQEQQNSKDLSLDFRNPTLKKYNW